MPHPVYERAVDLLEADLHGEMVALDPDAGQCFGFNAVATSVWRLLDRPMAEPEIRAGLLEEFDVDDATCRDQLSELLEDLSRRGLIRACPPVVSP